MQAWARRRDGAIADALRASAAGSRRALDPRAAAREIGGGGWEARVAQDAHETLGRLLDALQFGRVGAGREGEVGVSRGLEEAVGGEEEVEGMRYVGGGGADVAGSSRDVSDLGGGGVRRRAAAAAAAAVVVADMQSQVADASPPLCGWTGVVRECGTCGEKGDAVLHTFAMLSLPLPTSDRTLSRTLLESFASTDTGVEAHCEVCRITGPHTRHHSIARFPRVLALHLQKAYLAAGDTVSAARYATHFPERLTLPRGNPVPVSKQRIDATAAGGSADTSGSGASAAGGGTVRYRLRSVVQHYGGSGAAAHFVAVVGGGGGGSGGGSSTDGASTGAPADGLAGLCGRRWWLVDDGRVRPCTRANALDPQSAYLLFYELVEAESDDWSVSEAS